VEPTWKAMEEIVVEIVHRVFNLDSLESSHRINIPASNPDEIFEVFDDISYNKGRHFFFIVLVFMVFLCPSHFLSIIFSFYNDLGASIIRMMTHYLTEPTFRKGLNNYLKAL